MLRLCVCVFLFIIFLLRSAFHVEFCLSMGPVYCARDSQTYFFNKTFIKNGSHGIIHTFKNYFAIMFSVFSKISGIQTDPKCAFGIDKRKITYFTFSLFLLLFMDPTALFRIIYGFHCIILANFYLYLQYFQQKVFSFNKISEFQTNHKDREYITHQI